MNPYSLLPLASMLGIKAGSKVSVINPPPGFVQRLNPLPDGVEFLVTARSGLDVILYFATQSRELVERLPALARAVTLHGGIWVCWPSPTHLQTSLSEDFIRQAALDIGLVDNKVCFIDSVWTGLRLVRRQRPRPDKPGRGKQAPLAQA
jgi:hypothetical protein